MDKKIIICKSEHEAKVLSKNISQNDPYPVYFFKTETSGEKLYEEFYTEKDKTDMISYNSIGIITNTIKPSFQEINSIIEELDNLFKKNDYSKSDIIKIINNYLPGFSHIETGQKLDDKM